MPTARRPLTLLDVGIVVFGLCVGLAALPPGARVGPGAAGAALWDDSPYTFVAIVLLTGAAGLGVAGPIVLGRRQRLWGAHVLEPGERLWLEASVPAGLLLVLVMSAHLGTGIVSKTEWGSPLRALLLLAFAAVPFAVARLMRPIVRASLDARRRVWASGQVVLAAAALTGPFLLGACLAHGEPTGWTVGALVASFAAADLVIALLAGARTHGWTHTIGLVAALSLQHGAVAYLAGQG